jgi:hypothetical protein
LKSVWSRLALYESSDFVRRAFYDEHLRELNTSKAQEIVAHFAQGREYFASAATASPLLRPLLLYYGVVGLSRGAILFLRSNARQASLRPSHGLEVVDWNNILGLGLREIPNLTIRRGMELLLS